MGIRGIFFGFTILVSNVAIAVPSKNVLIGKVVKVTDGDTITVLTADNEEERIRLWGIDAPEKRGGQPFWEASRDQLAALVAGKTVTVTWDKRDRKLKRSQRSYFIFTNKDFKRDLA